ncbi:MAG: DUF1553 domain-containing protein [Acidobacteriota bacterium]|nr:DUF1553 domain-containing protein [Acidobacteriota bacterium]
MKIKHAMMFFCMCFSLLVAAGDSSVIDDYLENRTARGKKITDHAAPMIVLTDDLSFLRRVWLDVAGTLPPTNTLEAWLQKPQPWDREAMVDEVLASDAYVDRWTHFFEALINSRAFPQQLAMRNHQHRALRTAVADNLPWDALARQIIAYHGPVDTPGSFYNMFIEASNAALIRQDALDDEAAFITEKFLGVQTNCISCHDGRYHLEEINVYLTEKKRTEFWGLAAFLSKSVLFCRGANCFANGQVRYQYLHWESTDRDEFRNNGYPFIDGGRSAFRDGRYYAKTRTGEGMRPARNGGYIEPAYPFTGETPAPDEPRRDALARILTADRQFARNMVNRVWMQLIGRTFVEPVEGFDLARLNAHTAAEYNTTVQPEDPELLEFMTDRFIETGYNMKTLIRDIAVSKIYGMDYARFAEPERGLGPYWGGVSRVRRLEAETLLNNIFNLVMLEPKVLAQGLEGIVTNFWGLPDTQEPGYIPGNEVTAFRLQQLGVRNHQELLNYQGAVRDLLSSLGRADRDTGSPPDEHLGHATSLALLNNPVVIYLLEASPLVSYLAELVRAGDREEVVNLLFSRGLYRLPTETERRTANESLEAGDPETAIRDILWTLISHPDFLFR